MIPAAAGGTPSTLRYLWTTACGRHRRTFAAMVLLETVAAACGILLPYALGRILGLVSTSQGDPEAVMAAITAPLALFALLCAGELVAGRASSYIQWRAAPRQRQSTARQLFAHLQRHSYRFLSDQFAGALAARISEVSHGVNLVLFALITEFWPTAIVILIANGLLLAANPWLGLFTSAWSAGFLGLSFVLARRIQPRTAAASSARSATAGQIVDAVANHAAIRLFARLDHELERLDRRYREELAVVERANLAMERVRLFQFGAAVVLKVGVVLLAVALWRRGALGVGQFVMAVSLALLVIAEVRNLSRRFIDLFETLGNVSSGVRAILHPHELTDRPAAAARPIRRGAIGFTAVDFRYPDGVEVFSGLTVAIPAGQRVGLVGTSGSGKSTFVSLLLRLHDPQSGSIAIDGHDLRDLTQDALHAQVGLIPQDPTLFHRTLRENIRYGRPAASDAEVEAAAIQAHADDFIRRIPGGYDSQVGERGVKLSGGQRQRIAIARVILKDAPVLILDEATSALDSHTEQAIQDTLGGVMRGKTAIVIAHRLSTIAHLDRILVFDRGRIIEDGTHGGLLARGGAYARLWDRQAGGPGAWAGDAVAAREAAAVR